MLYLLIKREMQIKTIQKMSLFTYQIGKNPKFGATGEQVLLYVPGSSANLHNSAEDDLEAAVKFTNACIL